MHHSDSSSPLLVLRGIDKRFPGVRALHQVDFDIFPGEVHALVGENGAGKSTLMHILAGVQQPDAGMMAFAGTENIRMANERAAQDLGIAIVFQERSLFSPLTIAENIFAGRQPVTRWGWIDQRRLHRDAGEWLAQTGLDADPSVAVADLSPAQQQLVEIAKALSLQARLIIFDEPTAALSDADTRALFDVIRRLKAQGVGVIYISHRLEEIFQIADRVTVLRDGERQGTFRVTDTNPDQLVARMVGRELQVHQRQAEMERGSLPMLLEVQGLNDAHEFAHARPFLEDIDFSVRSGEIVVLAGLTGAGRTELAQSIFGVRARASGEIRLARKLVDIQSPSDAIAAGIGYAPEDRKEAGLFLDMTVAQNIAAARLNLFGAWWFDDRARDRVADEFRERLRIATRGVDQLVEQLSGGNQQKIVLARWLLVKPRVLIVDEPTRGIDVGAKAEVHAVLRELARQGTAVVVISSDLPEVLAIADRIVVMRAGRIRGELSAGEANEEAVVRLASIE